MFRFRPGKFHRRTSGSTILTPPPVEQTSHGSVTWKGRPGALLRRSSARDTVLEPYFTDAGSSTAAFVGHLVESVEGDFTYVFVPPLVGVDINGVSYVIRRESISIHEIEGTSPNTCSFKVQGVEPLVEQSVDMVVGGEIIFAGWIQNALQGFDEITTQLWWNVSAIDHTWILNYLRPFGRFENVSATTVVQTITARYAPAGFTTSGVQAGLPEITIEFDGSQTFMECLTSIKNKIGARCKVSYTKVISLYLARDEEDPDQLNNTTNVTLVRDPQLTSSKDTSQLRNKVYVKGAGSNVAADIPIGSIRIPVDDISIFPLAGQVFSAGQILSYGITNVSRVRSRAIPPPPILSQCLDLNFGSYTPQNIQVRESWTYADGYESAPGPPSATIAFDGTKKLCIHTSSPPANVIGRRIWVASVDQPNQPTWTNQDTALLTEVTDPSIQDFSEDWKGFTFGNGTFEVHHTQFFSAGGLFNALGGGIFETPNPPITGDATATSFAGDKITINPSEGGGPLEKTINTLPTGFTPVIVGASFKVFDASGVGAGLPAIDASVSGPAPAISLPPSGEISHLLTFAYDPPLSGVNVFTESFNLSCHLLTATGKVVQIQMVDSASKSNFLLSGTYTREAWTKSILPSGAYERGNTSIGVTNPEIFCNTGGRVNLNGSSVDYTGISDDGELIGIPPTGPGSIGCDHVDENGDPIVDDGCEVTPVETDGDDATPIGPGIDGNGCEAGTGTLILNAPTEDFIPKGSAVNIWVQRDDFESQAEWKVREGPVISDPTLFTIEQAAEVGDAELDLFSQPIVTVEYSTRDRKTGVGKIVNSNLTNPPLVGSFLIQDVTITQVDEADNLQPLLRVHASSVKFTLDDLLRRVQFR